MSEKKSYHVIIVVDPNYGAQLSNLPAGVPVWVADTPVNKKAAVQIWAAHPDASHLEGLTTFHVCETESPDQWCASVLDAVDLHHGEQSHDPPYSAIEVIGAVLSRSLQQALAEYGLTVIKKTDNGIAAFRRAV